MASNKKVRRNRVDLMDLFFENIIYLFDDFGRVDGTRIQSNTFYFFHGTKISTKLSQMYACHSLFHIQYHIYISFIINRW